MTASPYLDAVGQYLRADGWEIGSTQLQPGTFLIAGQQSNGGDRSIEDAVVVRSDLAPNGGGIIVFEGTDNNGDLVQIIWTPGFDLEQWYWEHYTPSAEPGFWISDTISAYSHEYICFAASSRIATVMGGLPAGDIWVGDHVLTLDAGPQPVIWVGRREVAGQGRNAPGLFAPGAIGNHAPLRLSQQHRVLVCSPLVELMFGTPEVLVPAKALVNGADVRIDPCARIAYVHVLLPGQHRLSAEGAGCETLLPGEMVQGLAGLPPRLARLGFPAARPVLSFAEAIALVGTGPDPQVTARKRPVAQAPAL